MQQVWRKRWRNTAWLALGAITLVLLVYAGNKKNHKACPGIEVTFTGDGNNFFIGEKGVAEVLKGNGLVLGQPVETINLRALEATLKNDQWIANAQLFFDNSQMLQVIVEEKTPVARIFTAEGVSYYIDSACKKLPLSGKLSARIPMFTNFPSDREKLSKPDSELLASVKELAMFIQADDFWRAQVSQVDITPDGFVMIPTVGDHIVELGKGGNWQQKFDRLFSFYKQVWTKVGFEKYGKIDVKFDGQVVATLKGAKSAAIDSAKAGVAYDHLVEDVTALNEDSNQNDSTPAAVKHINKGVKAVLVKNTAVASAKTQMKRILTDTKNIKSQAKKELPTRQIANSTAGKYREKEPVKRPVKQTQAKQMAVSKQSDGSKMPKAVMRKPLIPL